MRAKALIPLFCVAFAALVAADDDVVKPPKKAREGETWLSAPSNEPPRAPAPLGDFLDLRGIFHAHSKYSHDSKVEPERIVAIANALGIDFFFMTDHPSPRSLTDGLRGRHGRTLFFAGAENDGMLELDLKEQVKGSTRKECIEAIKAQGGLALIAHPEEWTDWSAPFEGMEIFNLHYATLKSGPLGDAMEKARDKKGLDKLGALLGALEADPDAKRVLAAFDHMDDDPEGLLLELIQRPKLYLERWDELGKTRRVPGVAGNDSHENVKIGDTQLDPYARTLRVVDTHLFARGKEAGDVREALLAGRAYVAHEVFGESRGFVFFARGADGATRAVLGEEIPLAGEVTLVARAPSGGTIRLLRDGKSVRETKGESLEVVVRAGGVYRVEVDVERRGRTFPWITSNPIYVREAD